jgi:hypothetical protein
MLLGNQQISSISDNRKMGDPLFVGELQKTISDISGIVNVVDLRVFGKTGGEYSSAEVSQGYSDEDNKTDHSIRYNYFYEE